MTLRSNWVDINNSSQNAQMYIAQDIGWAKHANLRPVIAALTDDGQ